MGDLGLRWSSATGAAISSSPAVANGLVYVGSNNGNLYALNAASGALLWQYTTGGTVGSSPVVANGAVLVGSDDHYVYALNASTGALIWNLTGNSVASSPTVVNAIVYVGSEDGNLYGLDVGTGALVWQYATGSAIDSSPAVANGVVYCANPVLPGRRWAEITDSGPTQDRQKTNVTALRKVILTTDLKNFLPGSDTARKTNKIDKIAATNPGDR